MNFADLLVHAGSKVAGRALHDAQQAGHVVWQFRTGAVFHVVDCRKVTGALCVWLSVGISLLGFGLTLRSVEARTGRLSLDSFHGLYEHTPILAGLFLLTGLASIGFPGTVGFIGTELLVEGAIGVYPFVGLAVVLAATLNGVAVVLAYFRVFTGTRHLASISLKCRTSERITILILTALIVGGGLYPQPGVSSRYHAAVALMEHRGVKAADDHSPADDHSHVETPAETAPMPSPVLSPNHDQ